MTSPTRAVSTPMLFCCLMILGTQSSPAQSASTPAPAALPDNGLDSAYVNWFAGPAVSTRGSGASQTFTAGVTFGQYFARTLGHGLLGSPQFELGIVGPLQGGRFVDGLAGVDYMFANKLPRCPLYPSFTAGYTRLFATGNAVNAGLAIDFGRNPYARIYRIELRDYYLFTGPTQNVLSLRFALGAAVAD